MRALVLGLLLLSSGCGGPGASSQAARAPAWTLTGFADPESVAASDDGRTLYVTNVAGEGEVHDGDGYISRVSADGRMLERRWVTGLDAPKGAVVSGGKLYVSDIDKLVEIDIAGGKVTGRYPAPGATFLNDVAIARDGMVLVSDSGTGRIFALRDGRLAIWADAAELKSVNGLYPEPSRLIVTTMEGKLLAIGYADRSITQLAAGLGQADGVAPAGGGDYFVGEWPGRLFRVGPDGRSRVLLDSRAKGVYINDFIRRDDLLLAPNWKPGSLTAYPISALD